MSVETFLGYQAQVNRPVGQDVAAHAEVEVRGTKAFVSREEVRETVPEYGLVVLLDGRMVSASLVRAAAELTLQDLGV